jgi:aspartate carbamoyltransferase catalytic subunit
MPRLGKYDLISIDDLELEEIERIFAAADELSRSLERGDTPRVAEGLIMATLFYEPSTRTRLSFESAMHRLGGSVISAPDMQTSSAAKGESLADTVRVVSAYADLVVLRHPREGAAKVAAAYAAGPVINAGDGSREHPTQTLCDLYVLRKKKGRLKGLTVALCGDLRYGRTVHSLMYALARFGANILAAPNRAMEVPEYVLARLAAQRGYSYATVGMNELNSLAPDLDALYLTPSGPHQMALFTGGMAPGAARGVEPVLPALDALYVTRPQRERHSDETAQAEDYLHVDARTMRGSRTQAAVIMHPLPRTDELAYELDSDPRAVYFEQAAAGVPVRMALIDWLIRGAGAARAEPRGNGSLLRFKSGPQPVCGNHNCITRSESAYLPPRLKLAAWAGRPARSSLALQCDFCEQETAVEYVGNARSHRYYRFDENLRGYARRWLEEGSLAVFRDPKQAEESGYEPYRRGPQREVMNAAEMARAVESLAEQLIADLPDLTAVTIVGVLSQGAALALRLRESIEGRSGLRMPCAAVNVLGEDGALLDMDGGPTVAVDGRTIVLLDDVINSGWTVQRAMAALWKMGRPSAVKLAVLIDRGHRMLPIRPNYAGKNLPTAATERVRVYLAGHAARGKRKAPERVVVFSMVESLEVAPQRETG